jgi:hypothetical protein
MVRLTMELGMYSMISTMINAWAGRISDCFKIWDLKR